MRSTTIRAAIVAALLMSLTGCGQGASPGATTEPGAKTAWDVLFITDSTEFGVPKPYAQLASEELGRKVNVINWQVGGLSIVEAHKMVDRQPHVVARAEIIVLWGGPEDLDIDPGHLRCIEATGDPGTYTRDDFDPFEAEIGATLDAIWAARAGEPTVVRLTDIYVPIADQWKAAGIYDACMQIWEFYSDAVRDAAESHGAVAVSTWDVYNGKNHDEDPVEKGYIAEDGIHPARAGSEAMAEALAAVGFEPTRP